MTMSCCQFRGHEVEGLLFGATFDPLVPFGINNL